MAAACTRDWQHHPQEGSIRRSNAWGAVIAAAIDTRAVLAGGSAITHQMPMGPRGRYMSQIGERDLEVVEAWGILRPGDIPSARRLQALGLTSAVRHFNERAVPGMGGLWFAMPLVWSMLGISVARKLHHRPIEAANAVEALAMKEALAKGGGESNPRVRGSRNLPYVTGDFQILSKPGSYVTQPFRQTCTQPLVTLGLVQGTRARFNSFDLTEDGRRLLAPLGIVPDLIEKWVCRGMRPPSDDLAPIAPTACLPDAIRAELTRRIYGEGADAERRKAIRDMRGDQNSDALLNASLPAGLTHEHLVDLRGGIAAVQLRAAALEVLGAVENRISRRRDDGLTPSLSLDEAERDEGICAKIEACVVKAERVARHIEAANEPESQTFLGECRTPNGLVRRLAKRDGVVIVLRDEELAPGPAFGADAVPEGDTDAATSGVPELPRIANLLALTADLCGANSQAVGGDAP